MKLILSSEQLQRALLLGCKQLYEAVASTLGPSGNSVIISSKGKNPFSTKDGVTVARHYSLENEFENLGVSILKEVAVNTEKTAGDGTTTSIILAYSILNEAQKYLLTNCNVHDLVFGMEQSVKHVVSYLRKNSKPIKSKEDIEKVATLSANWNKQIGSIVANAIDAVGSGGSILVENSNSYDTSLQLIEGFNYPSGFVSHSFLENETKNYLTYNNPFIFITDYKLETVDQLMPVLEIAARESRPLIVVADRIEGQALGSLVYNAVRGSMKVVGVNAAYFGEEKRNVLKDACLSVGAELITAETGLQIKDIKLNHLGTCKFAEIQKNSTTFVDGSGDYKKIEQRIELLKSELKEEEDISVCERIQQRITRLGSAIAIIKVGGMSEIEVQEKRYRIDDALEAVKSAQQEGILPGSGIVLVQAAEQLKQLKLTNEDQVLGRHIIEKAIQTPFQRNILNAGRKNPEVILSQLKHKRKQNSNLVYDVKNDEIVNAYDIGIVDPTKVIRCSLENALSVVSQIITTSFAIVEKDGK